MGYITFEEQYLANIKNILDNGFYQKNERTSVATKRLPFTQLVTDLEKEPIPILKSKKVNWKAALNEILWIMQKQSNNIHDLNSQIWDKWADEDGSIGRTYGYQIGLPTKEFNNQVEYVLETLKKDPSSRQAVIDMWNPTDLSEMNLPPCVFASHWTIIDGKLNCMLVQRSADYFLGVPFDHTQYAILTHLFARHLGVKPGLLTHVMADSHLYENQFEPVEKQLKQAKNVSMFILPTIHFTTDDTNFWNFKEDEVEVNDYDPQPFIRAEVIK